MRMPLHYLSAALLLVATLASCTITPKQPVSELTIPATWSEVPENGTHPRAVELVRWWTTFDDPTLDTLITRGIEANRDIREATARVREARALRTSTAAEGWPRIGSSASYTRSL